MTSSGDYDFLFQKPTDGQISGRPEYEIAQTPVPVVSTQPIWQTPEVYSPAPYTNQDSEPVKSHRVREIMLYASSLVVGGAIGMALLDNSDKSGANAAAPQNPTAESQELKVPKADNTPDQAASEPTEPAITEPAEPTEPAESITPDAVETVPPPPPVETTPVEYENAQLKIATWNTLNPLFYGDSGYGSGDKLRMYRVGDKILDEQVDIMFTQEMLPVAKADVEKKLDPEFKATPSNINGNWVDDVAFYNSEVMKLKDVGTFTIPKMGIKGGFDLSRTREAEWFEFELNNTQDPNAPHLFFINMHADTNPAGRAIAATKLLNIIDVIQKMHPDAMIHVVGDMNSNYFSENRKQIYEALTKTGKFMLSTFATDNQINLRCDTHHGDDGIPDCGGRNFKGMEVGSQLDQIWLESDEDINVTSWKNDVSELKKVSDHSLIIVKATYPHLVAVA